MYIRPNFEKRYQIRVPQLNRNRLALRSPIRSDRTNLEDHQLSYDIHALYGMIAAFIDAKEEIYTEFEESFEDVMTDLQTIEKRIRRLEDQ